MDINIKDFVEIIVGAIAIGTLVHRISESKSKLERSITESHLELERKIEALDHKLEIHVATEKGRDELSDYVIHGIDKKIDHKFLRLWDNVRELQQYLAKKFEYTFSSY